MSWLPKFGAALGALVAVATLGGFAFGYQMHARNVQVIRVPAPPSAIQTLSYAAAVKTLGKPATTVTGARLASLGQTPCDVWQSADKTYLLLICQPITK